MKNYLHFSENASKDFIEEASNEANYIGFYNLPDQETSDIKEFAKGVTVDTIAVIGIGGSSLGAEAIYQFLNPKYKYSKKLIFLDTTDPIAIENRLNSIDLDSTLFIVISKSGTTVESIAILKYLDRKIEFTKENLIVITDQSSPLEEFAHSRELKIFHIPDNVGGRYSVLSPVGLLPLAIVGVNIDALLRGAKRTKDRFFSKEDDQIVVKKATHYAKISEQYSSNCLFSYSELLRGFNSWYVQLWAESLGKRQLHSTMSVGLTPIGLVGPTDQHSFLQLIMEGKSDKSVTVIKIKNFESELKIPENSLHSLEKLNMLDGLHFSELINLQADSTIEALQKIGVPLDVIELERVGEESIGELVYYYELLTALVAMQLDINAYDQPGVELGKKILKSKMAKS
jgi:glucose-6-phosphate isomerase